MSETETFWDRVSYLLKRRGWRPEQLASKAGVSAPTVSQWKSRPERVPSGESLQRVSDALGVSVDQLLGKRPIHRAGADPVGHLKADEERVVEAMRADERIAKIIRKIADEFPAPDPEDDE